MKEKVTANFFTNKKFSLKKKECSDLLHITMTIVTMSVIKIYPKTHFGN